MLSVELKGKKKRKIGLDPNIFYIITTRPPAVTDVLGFGHNLGALRPGRRVGFRSLGAKHSRQHFLGTHFFKCLQLLNY